MEEVKEKLDTTILNICEWVDKELINVNSSYESSILPQTISALAELVEARGYIEITN